MHVFSLETFMQRSKSIVPLRDSGERSSGYKGKMDFYITSQAMSFIVKLLHADPSIDGSQCGGLVSQTQRIFACLLKEKRMALSVSLFRTDLFEAADGKCCLKGTCVNICSSVAIQLYTYIYIQDKG